MSVCIDTDRLAIRGLIVVLSFLQELRKKQAGHTAGTGAEPKTTKPVTGQQMPAKAAAKHNAAPRAVAPATSDAAEQDKQAAAGQGGQLAEVDMKLA